jgi:hypothetical protein
MSRASGRPTSPRSSTRSRTSSTVRSHLPGPRSTGSGQVIGSRLAILREQPPAGRSLCFVAAAGQSGQANAYFGRLSGRFAPFEPDAADIFANDTGRNASTLDFPERCGSRLQVHHRKRPQVRCRRHVRARRTDVPQAPDPGRPRPSVEAHHKVGRLSSSPTVFHKMSLGTGSLRPSDSLPRRPCRMM